MMATVFLRKFKNDRYDEPYIGDNLFKFDLNLNPLDGYNSPSNEKEFSWNGWGPNCSMTIICLHRRNA